MRRAVTVLAAFLFACSPAFAALRISFDPGGTIGEFVEKYTMLREAEGKVIIDGLCASACTLITAILDDDQVCVTSRARLAFHSGRDDKGHSSEGTRVMWNMYPEKVRAILRARGWDGDDSAKNEHPDLIYVEGAELRTIYRDCAAPSA